MKQLTTHAFRVNESKTKLLILNLILLLGVSILVITLFYLLFHLNNSDKIIYLCIPGFAAGISSIFIYGFLSPVKHHILFHGSRSGKSIVE